MAKGYAIGIDLGTTYSCVAVWRHERVEILANDQGNRVTPSYVAFTGDGRLVGDAAANQAIQNPASTIFGIKRIIGGRFSDKAIQEDIKQWPFRVKNQEGKPVVEVEYLGEKRTFTPEEISAMILAKMKQTAEKKLGPVKDAVITVPAYFNNSQRMSTKDAAEVAGLNVLRILSEPTAAALAYGIDSHKTTASNILVYDLGGGTFDVSLLRIEEGKFVVLATAGDTHLGGEDFDIILATHFAQVFKQKHGCDISSNARAMSRLRSNCERAKRALSFTTLVHVEVDSLYEGIDFSSGLTRAKFESLCQRKFLMTIKSLESILKDAEISPEDIDEVVLSGGSSRIPKIQRMVSSFFSGKALNTSIHFDEAVAGGAAIQAAYLSGSFEADITAIVVVDVTPLSLGIQVLGIAMEKVIERNSTLPVTITKDFTTTVDFQKEIKVSVYEGESISTRHNLLLGEFLVKGISSAPRGVPKIQITFTIDFDGILTVTACDKETQSTNTLITTGHRNRLSRDHIHKMIEDAKVLDTQDERMRIQYHSLLDFEAQSEIHTKKQPSYIGYAKAQVKGFVHGLLAWIDEH
ncbi:Hsp70 chaperone [Entomophthora muscae]|uniref:Hsp70 chaperone n=1 Tax=Entomophthora muscae TaxID=34485 RepID=A0ACC2RK74_9FUNG|nr:Hsp70 chaperone [Entomophthora muscae]